MRAHSPALLLYLRQALLGAGLVASGLVVGCSGAHEPTQQVEHGAGHSPELRRAIVNVPAMLGKPVGSLRQRMQQSDVPLPAVYQDRNVYACLDPALADSIVAFRSGSLLLLACYDIRSRLVHDLLLLGHREDSLMQQTALRPNAAKYLVLPVFRASRAGSLLGLRVVDISGKHN